MTKLEEKLIEWGYRHYYDNSEGYLYIKTHNKKHIFSVLLSYSKRRIENYDVSSVYDFQSQKDIDNLQKAFNEFQKDLELLKGAEDEKNKWRIIRFFRVKGRR